MSIFGDTFDIGVDEAISFTKSLFDSEDKREVTEKVVDSMKNVKSETEQIKK